MKKSLICSAMLLTASLILGSCVYAEDLTVRVGSMKGPTSMGIVSFMEKAEKEETSYNYEFNMVTAADELLAQMIGGKLDIALVPANVASVLYNKTEGAVSVIDLNTLGVLYVAECGDSIQSISDLAGKTIYLTGKGTSPDYVLQYLLNANGLTTDDVTLEYKSEATEVVSVLAQDNTAIGLLPQPFITAAGMQNENLRIALDLTAEWEKTREDGGSLVTGVTIVTNDFLAANPDAVTDFLKEHELSASYTNDVPEEAAKKIVELGIVAKEPIALKAIPFCNITCVTGEEMKTSLEGYLQVLYDLEPTAVGGALPADDFYYLP